ncbi:MAG: hypothetical protein HY040_02585 [Planctomycetes bacterium]|nr:hypothetical protein [Planctomycetota bacterium]
MKKVKGRKDGSREKQRCTAPAPTKADPSSSKLRWVAALALIALAGAGGYSILHFYVLTRIPLAMVGTWVVMEVKIGGGDKSNEALKGGRMQFHRDGTMILQTNMDGKGYTIKATVEVEDDTLRITTVNPSNKRETATDVHTIRTLERDRFVIEDRKGTILMMERLRE